MGDSPDWSLVQQNTIASAVIAPGGQLPNIDISEYQTIIVSINNNAGSGIAAVTAQQVTNTPSTIASSELLTSDNTIGNPSFALPVLGSLLNLFNDTAVSIRVFVVGTTSIVPKSLSGEYFPSRLFSASVASGTASNTLTQLAAQDVGLRARVPELSGYNGSVTLRLNKTSGDGATSWQWMYGYTDNTGNRVLRVFTITTGSIEQLITIGHPLAYCSWWVRNIGVLTAIGTPSITIMPDSIGG